MNTNPMDGHLSPLAARAAGLALAALAACAHGVALWLWFEGLRATVPDEGARQALQAVGVLLASGQLVAFAAAAWLPARLRAQRRMLVALGIVLLAAEIAAAALGHLGVVHAADTAAGAGAARIEQLQRAHDSARASAQGLRELAAQQTAAGAITAAGRALRQAVDVDAHADQAAGELAALQAAQRPSLTGALGPEHSAGFVVTRAALVALLGLVMSSVAGALWREARGPALPAPMAVPVHRPVAVQPLRGAPVQQALTHRYIAAAIAPLAAVAPVVAAVPVHAPVVAAVHRQGVTNPAPVRAAAVPAAGDGSRYAQIRAGVQGGSITPSVRGIRAAVGGGTDQARAHLARLEAEGVTRRQGRGWVAAA